MPESERFGREDFAILVGGAMLLLGFLLLTSTPEAVYRWSKRSGYTRTEVEVLSPASGYLSTMSVRVLSTGDELSVRRNTFDKRPQEGSRLPVWYNPEALLVVGFRVFDQRILSAKTFPERPGGAGALVGLAVNFALFAVGWRLLNPPEKTRPRTARKKKRAR